MACRQDVLDVVRTATAQRDLVIASEWLLVAAVEADPAEQGDLVLPLGERMRPASATLARTTADLAVCVVAGVTPVVEPLVLAEPQLLLWSAGSSGTGVETATFDVAGIRRTGLGPDDPAPACPQTPPARADLRAVLRVADLLMRAVACAPLVSVALPPASGVLTAFRTPGVGVLVWHQTAFFSRCVRSAIWMP